MLKTPGSRFLLIRHFLHINNKSSPWKQDRETHRLYRARIVINNDAAKLGSLDSVAIRAENDMSQGYSCLRRREVSRQCAILSRPTR